MRTARLPGLFAILVFGACCGTAASQQKVFNWLPANDESVRLDPANYHTGRTYRPSTNGANNHVDIKSEKPGTIFMTPEAEWNVLLQKPSGIAQLHEFCVREQ